MDNSDPAFSEVYGLSSLESSSDRDGTYKRILATGGMSLRDYFAGQALAGLTNVAFTYFTGAVDGNKDGARKFSAEIGQTAYMVADAMLVERSKT